MPYPQTVATPPKAKPAATTQVPYIHTPPYTIHHFTPYPQFSEGTQVAPERIVVSESDTSDNDIIQISPLAPSTRRSARFRTPRMQTTTQSLKRKPNSSSSSSSSSTSEDEPVTSSAYTIHHLIPCPQPPPSVIHPYTTSSAYTIHHYMPCPQPPPLVKAKPAAASKVSYIHTPTHQHTPLHHLMPYPQPPPVKAKPAATTQVPYIHTPPYTIHHFTPYPQFSAGMQVAPKETPYEEIKENCMSIFRTMGHVPITRTTDTSGGVWWSDFT